MDREYNQIASEARLCAEHTLATGGRVCTQSVRLRPSGACATTQTAQGLTRNSADGRRPNAPQVQTRDSADATQSQTAPLLTIFTPTYNRAHLLPRLYESLCRQTFNDFEWVIVDDGSTDETKELFGGAIQTPPQTPMDVPSPPFRGLGGQVGMDVPSSPFRGLGGLRYIRQANGGKHRAINRGVQEAQGELFFIVDSDDWLPNYALAIVYEQWQSVKDDPKVGGVCGLDMTPDGKVIGSGLPSDRLVCSSIDIRLKQHVTGDLKEVFRTSVLREMPFPEFEGEKFCPEALAWNRIAQKYDLLFFNTAIYIADYQPGGLTDRIVRVRMESPLASTTCYQEMVGCDIPLKQKVKAAINYWRFAACLPRGAKAPQLPWYWRICQPAGQIMHKRDLRVFSSQIYTDKHR